LRLGFSPQFCGLFGRCDLLGGAASDVDPIVGRVLATGYLDELDERGYAIVDGINGRAHHIPLGKRDPSEFAKGSIVEVRPTPPRAADRNVAALSRQGTYLTKEHRFRLRAQVILTCLVSSGQSILGRWTRVG
jgi:hypothetical protein